MEEKVVNFASCTVCMGERIRGDIVVSGCDNNHNFCIICILSWAAEPACTLETLGCPVCRCKNIGLSYVPFINDLICASAAVKPIQLEGDHKVESCLDIENMLSWKQIKSLSRAAHTIFPLAFPQRGGVGNVLTKQQLLLLAKNRRLLVLRHYSGTKHEIKAEKIDWNDRIWTDAQGRLVRRQQKESKQDLNVAERLMQSVQYIPSAEEYLENRSDTFIEAMFRNVMNDVPIEDEISQLNSLFTESARGAHHQLDFTWF